MTKGIVMVVVLIASVVIGCSVCGGQAFFKESALLFVCTGFAYIFVRGLLGVGYEFTSWVVKVLGVFVLVATLIGGVSLAAQSTTTEPEIYLSHWRSVVAEPQKTFTYFLTGNDLLKICQQETKGDTAYCMGFILGVTDVLGDASFTFIHSEKATVESMVRTPCFPKETTPEQLRDVVVKFLVDHPAVRHQPAESLVYRSFEFSCHSGK